ncbi:hypothetical protein [Desulfobacter sp.]|uniref:hypothetical protein n=1 Tax=Desulfobacter sp. TaxID=2294 RepID=UPI00257CAF10|nr:hypothetical protein [Desulfobacter sp.]
MTKRKIETFNQAGTNRQPHFRQTLRTAANPIDQLLKSPLTLLFDQLSIDQIRVRFLYRFLWTAGLSIVLVAVLDRITQSMAGKN